MHNLSKKIGKTSQNWLTLAINAATIISFQAKGLETNLQKRDLSLINNN